MVENTGYNNLGDDKASKIALPNPFMAAMLVCCALMYAIYCLGIGIPESVLPLCFAVVLLFFRERDFLALGACSGIFGGIKGFTIVWTLSLIVYFAKYGHKFRLRSIFWIIFGFLIIEFFDGSVFVQNFDFIDFIRWGIRLFYFAFCVGLAADIESKDLLQVMKNYVITYCCTAVILLQRFATEVGGLANLLFSGKRLGDMANFYGRVQDTGISNGLSFNPNELGVFSVLCFGICLLLLHLHYGRRVVWIGIACFATGVVLLTLSRGAMVMWTAVTLIYFFDFRSLRKVLLFTPALIVMVCGFGFFLYSCNDSLAIMVDNMVGRFTMDGDISAGRLDLWELWNNYFFSNPQYWLTGIGSNNIMERIDSIGIGNCIHGGFQEAYVYWGVIGLVLMFALNWSIYKIAKKAVGGKMTKFNFLLMIAIWLQFSKGQYMSGVFPDQIIATVAMAFPFWKYGNESSNNNSIN